MKSPKRIGFLMYSLAGGGIEKNIINIVQRIYDSNSSCFLILIQRRNDYDQLSIYKNRHFPIIYLSTKKNTGNSILHIFKMFFRLLRILKMHNIHQIIAVDPLSWIFSFLAAIVTRTEYIMNVCIPFEYEKWIFSFLLYPILKKSKKIICVSNGLRNHLIKKYSVSSNKVITIYNGIYNGKPALLNEKDKYNLAVIKSLTRNNTVFITLGRLENQKNHIQLVREFQKVNQQIPKTKLVIIGQGQLKKKITKLIENLKLQKSVFIFDFSQNPIVFLKYADIFVFSSIYEGFGTALIEAMANGLPVISTDCPYGPKEILDDSSIYNISNKIIYGKYGILVPNYSEYLLSKAMINLVTNINLQRRYRMKSKIRSMDFTYKRMLVKYAKAIL